MKRERILSLAAATTLGLSVGVLALGSLPATAASPPVHTGTTSVGKVLVNATGKTLYVFGADTAGKSTCTGACAQAWPPVKATAKTLGHSADVKARLSVIKRSDGTTQLAINGKPAYTYSGDSTAGRANGQAANASGGVWYVIAPNGVVITSASGAKRTATSPGGSTSPGSSYDY